MRKFTLLCLALLTDLFANSAAAFTVDETPATAATLTSGYYVLKGRSESTTYSISRRSGYVGYVSGQTADKNFVQYDESSKTLSDISSDNNFLWYVTVDNNMLVIQNVGSGLFLNYRSSWQGDIGGDASADNAAVLKLTTYTTYDGSLSGGFLLTDAMDNAGGYMHTNLAADNSNLDLAFWNGGSTSSVSGSSLIEMAFLPVTNVTEETSKVKKDFQIVSFVVGSTTYGKAYTNGSTASWPSTLNDASLVASGNYSNYYITSAADITVSADSKTLTGTLTKSNPPFEFSTETDRHWYTLRTRPQLYDHGHFVATDDEIPYISCVNTGFNTTDIASYDKFLAGLWCFVESGNGVKIYNAAKKLYLTSNGNDIKATLTAEGTVFYTKSTTQDGATFSLNTGTTGGYIGSHCDQTQISSHYVGTKVGDWVDANNAQNDAGSAFAIASVDTDDILAVGKAAFQKQADAEGAKYDSDNNIVYRTDWSGNNTSAQSAENFTTLNALAETSAAAKTLAYDPTAYYTIRCCNTKGVFRFLSSEKVSVNADATAVSDESAETILYHVSDSTAVPHRLFQIPADGQIKSVNTGFYLNGASGLTPTAPESKFSYAITEKTFAGNGNWGTNDKTSMFLIRYGDATEYINAAGSTSFKKGLGIWNNETDPSNYWQFTKVTEIPVAIGVIGYASVCLPVPVTLSEGGTAYIVTGNTGATLNLQEITSGTVIPAGTGFLVASGSTEATTAKFTIASEEGATLEGNLMEGVNARRTGLTTGTNYVLTNNGNGKAVFRIYEPTAMPANKAYLKISSLTDSEGIMAFDFDGQVTGIAAATTSSANETYYDLNGRRVLYPTKGIYVKSNGQKVFIK